MLNLTTWKNYSQSFWTFEIFELISLKKWIKIKIKRRSKNSLDWTPSNPLILNLFQASQTPKGSKPRKNAPKPTSIALDLWVPPTTDKFSFFFSFFLCIFFLFFLSFFFAIIVTTQKNHHDIFFIQKFTTMFLLLLSFALIQMMTTRTMRDD